MADSTASRALSALQQLLGDIRLAVLAAGAVLSIGIPDPGPNIVVTCLGLGVVWIARRPPQWLNATRLRVWALTGLDLVTSILVLAITGVDSLALVYVAMTAATAALRLGLAGAIVAAGSVAGVHAVVLFGGGRGGTETAVIIVVLVLVRVGLVALSAIATARLRDLLITREALATEVQELRERQIREAERARLARDMHDSLAKTLHGVVLLTVRLRRRLERENPQLGLDARLIEQSLQHAQLEGRQILTNLRQEPVSDLRTALTALARDWEVEHGIGVQLKVPSTEPVLPDDGKAELLKAAAEILENTHRHAAASLVTLTLSNTQEHVQITIADDGIGMPEPDLAALSGSGHYGLVGVHERMSRIGGLLEIGAAPGGGTRVTLHAGNVEHVLDLTSSGRGGVLPAGTMRGGFG